MTLQHAPKRAAELRNELQSVSCLLDQMKEQFADVPETLASSRLWESMKRSTEEFEQMLQTIRGRIQKERTKGLQRLLWPFTNSENKEFLDRIERYKASFELALSIKQK